MSGNEEREVEDQDLADLIARVLKTARTVPGTSGRERERTHMETFLAAEDLANCTDAPPELREVAKELVTHTNAALAAMEDQEAGRLI